MKVTRPAITSASAGPLPLNGTLIIFVPVKFLEHRPGEVRRAAVARGRVAQLAGPRLGEHDQVLHRSDSGVRARHDHHRQHRRVAHRREVP